MRMLYTKGIVPLNTSIQEIKLRLRKKTKMRNNLYTEEIMLLSMSIQEFNLRLKITSR